MEIEQVPEAIKQIIINMIHNYEQNDVINKYTGIDFEIIDQIRQEIKPKQTKKDSIFKKIYQNKSMFLKFLEFKKQIPRSFFETPTFFRLNNRGYKT